MTVVLVVPEPKEKFMPYGPPLGLCYISSYLKKNGIQEVTGVDLNIDTVDDLRKTLAINAGIVGIYCSTKTLSESLKIAKIAKDYGSTVVIGGPHPTLCPEDTLKNDSVDFIIIGEGEIGFYELVDAIYHNKPYENISGIGYKDKQGKIVITPKDNWITDLDSLPFPDRSIFKLDKYAHRALTVTATRGCPYKCANCQPALNILCGKFRMRSVDNVIDEIVKECILKYRIRYIHFVDNDLTVNKKWITEFCNKLIELKLDIFWNIQGRVNTLDSHLMDLLKKAGCTTVSIGIESGSENIINQVLNKGIDLKSTKKLVDYAREIKFPIHVWLMIGIPGETKHDIENTINYALNLNAASIGFSIATPWPGTGFYSICKKNNWIIAKSWDEFNEKRYSVILTDQFTPKDVSEYRQKILDSFEKKRWKWQKENFIVSNPYYMGLSGRIIFFIKIPFQKLAYPFWIRRMENKFKNIEESK